MAPEKGGWASEVLGVSEKSIPEETPRTDLRPTLQGMAVLYPPMKPTIKKVATGFFRACPRGALDDETYLRKQRRRHQLLETVRGHPAHDSIPNGLLREKARSTRKNGPRPRGDASERAFETLEERGLERENASEKLENSLDVDA